MVCQFGYIVGCQTVANKKEIRKYKSEKRGDKALWRHCQEVCCNENPQERNKEKRLYPHDTAEPQTEESIENPSLRTCVLITAKRTGVESYRTKDYDCRTNGRELKGGHRG